MKVTEHFSGSASVQRWGPFVWVSGVVGERAAHVFYVDLRFVMFSVGVYGA